MRSKAFLSWVTFLGFFESGCIPVALPTGVSGIQGLETEFSSDAIDAVAVTVDPPFKVTTHDTSNHRNFTCSSADCDVVVSAAAGAAIALPGALSISPGDRVCIPKGTYDSLTLTSLRGTASQPIEIVNCGGQVRFTKNKQAIFAKGASMYFKLMGNGHASALYGFLVDQVTTDTSVVFSDKSRDFEASWIRVAHAGAGFAGVFAKTDVANYAGAAALDVETGVKFVQTNTHLHHFRIDRTGTGEGFYVGHFSCDPAAHDSEFRLRGVKIHDNVFLNTAAEALQVGCATEDVKIHHNYILHAGWDPFENTDDQKGGLQVGAGSTAEVYSNWIEDVQGRCIHIASGQSDPVKDYQVHFHDNTVKDCGSYIYFNRTLTNAQGAKTVRIEDNAFSSSRATAMHSWGYLNAGNANAFVPIEFIGNTFSGSISEAAFIRYDSSTTVQPVSSMKNTAFIGNVFD